MEASFLAQNFVPLMFAGLFVFLLTGIPVAFGLAANLKVKADVSWSRATDDAGGKNYFTVIGIPSRYTFQQATGSGFPSTINYTGNLTNPALGRTHIALRTGNDEAERPASLKAFVSMRWSSAYQISQKQDMALSRWRGKCLSAQ